MMKKIFTTILGLLFISALLVSCGPSSDDAIKYNDALIQEQAKVFEKENSLIEAINKIMPDKLDLLLADLDKQIKKSSDTVNKMKGFDGKTDMKDATLKILTSFSEVAETDYPERIKFAKIPDSLYSQEDDDKSIDLSTKIDDKLNKAIEDFIKLQKGFAAMYQFDLQNTGQDMKKERK